MTTRFGNWHFRSSWIPPTCSEDHLKTIEITGSGPLIISPSMLGAKWQTTVSVYYVRGGFPRWNDLHRWSRLIISQSVVFPHIGKTCSPLTSFFTQINIPDSSEESGKENTMWTQNMPFLLQLTGVLEAEAWVIYSSQFKRRSGNIHTASTVWETPPVKQTMLFNTMINNILYKYTTPTIHPFSDGFESLVCAHRISGFV